VRAKIETGLCDSEWIEIANYQLPQASLKDDDKWVQVNGTEKVILGDLPILADGAPVGIVSAKGVFDEKEKVVRTVASLAQPTTNTGRTGRTRRATDNSPAITPTPWSSTWARAQSRSANCTTSTRPWYETLVNSSVAGRCSSRSRVCICYLTHLIWEFAR
jgi:hypothetical protein